MSDTSYADGPSAHIVRESDIVKSAVTNDGDMRRMSGGSFGIVEDMEEQRPGAERFLAIIKEPWVSHLVRLRGSEANMHEQARMRNYFEV